jgi:hypothetical protein
VKLGSVRLTKHEFNTWIVGQTSDKWPHLFVGVGKTGIGLATWSEFRDAYVTAVQAKNGKWSPKKIAAGYGPMKSVDVLLPHLPSKAWFPYAELALEADKHETRFTETLRAYIDG